MKCHKAQLAWRRGLHMRQFHMRSSAPPIQGLLSTYIHAQTAACRPTTASPHPRPPPYFGDIMKRSASSDSKPITKTKRQFPQIPDYHLTPSLRDESGDIIWPAPRDQMEKARRFIHECIAAKQRTLIAPDKDADGLSSGVILKKTLELLGLDPSLISVHHVQKGGSIHDENEREAMATYKPAFIFVLDQGSRESPPVIDDPHRALVIDHHWAVDTDSFPQGAEHITACDSPPVATSSLLTYQICLGVHKDVANVCDWLCVVGTHGDLGNTLKWEPPFPDMKATFKKYTKKALNEVVSLINAPRRTSTYNVAAAWEALAGASAPADVLDNSTLRAARAEVNAEVERCAHVAPKFSADGRIAVFRISSPAQVHPVIAARWAGHLQSPKLEVVLVANEGYLPGLVYFSCRVPRVAKVRDPPVNIIELLQEIAEKAASPTLRERLGESFARGHKEASGGVVPKAEFEEFLEILEVDKKPAGTGFTKDPASKQSNTLMWYFEKMPAK